MKPARRFSFWATGWAAGAAMAAPAKAAVATTEKRMLMVGLVGWAL